MKSLVNFSIFIILCLSTLFYSCSEGTVLDDYEFDMGLEYYPLEVGKYLVYQVDSTTFNIEGSGVEILESTTYVKEEFVEINFDDQGDTIFVTERYEKKNLADEWVIKDVWSTQKVDLRVEKTAENLKLIKMVFPVQAGSDFNSTLYLDESTTVVVAGETVEMFKNWATQVLSVGETDSIGTFNFGEVATISYADDENLIEKRFSLEKYARGIGMVYREDCILDTQDLDGSKLWRDKADKGYILKQTLLEYN